MGVKKSPLLPLFLIVFVDVLGLTIIMPLLPFYAEKFGATAAMVGALVSAYAICQMLAGPTLGRWSDRFGRKPVLVISQIGTFIGFLVLAFAQSLWMLFLARIIDGLTAGNITVVQASIADVTAPEKRVKAYGIIGVSFGLGFLLGPAISAGLVDHGLNAPILASAALSFLSIVLTLIFFPKIEKTATGVTEKGLLIPMTTWKRFFAHKLTGPILILFLIFNWVFTSFTTGFALFAERVFTWHGHAFGTKEVSYVLASLGLYGILLQGGLVGRLNKKLGEVRLAVFGFFACFIGYGILAFTHTLDWLAVALFFSAFGTGVLRPALTSLLSQSVPPSEQGLAMGLAQSLGSIAQILAPLVAGFLIGEEFLKSWAIGMSVVSVLGYWMTMRFHGSSAAGALARGAVSGEAASAGTSSV